MVSDRNAKAVTTWLSRLELDEVGEVRAAIALSLAHKLDEAGLADSGTIAMAVPAIAKELRAVLDAILESQADLDEFTNDLFSQVGDSANS